MRFDGAHDEKQFKSKLENSHIAEITCFCAIMMIDRLDRVVIIVEHGVISRIMLILYSTSFSFSSYIFFSCGARVNFTTTIMRFNLYAKYDMFTIIMMQKNFVRG